jgi:hypothetical protein
VDWWVLPNAEKVGRRFQRRPRDPGEMYQEVVVQPRAERVQVHRRGFGATGGGLLRDARRPELLDGGVELRAQRRRNERGDVGDLGVEKPFNAPPGVEGLSIDDLLCAVLHEMSDWTRGVCTGASRPRTPAD